MFLMFYRSVITMRVYLKVVSLQVTRKMVYIDGISFGSSPSFPAIVLPSKKNRDGQHNTRDRLAGFDTVVRSPERVRIATASGKIMNE